MILRSEGTKGQALNTEFNSMVALAEVFLRPAVVNVLR